MVCHFGRVDNSKLLLKSSNFCNEDSLLNKFQEKGVDKKVKILDKFNFRNHEDHINLYKQIDLCLDTFLGMVSPQLLKHYG